jgi:hypothetical protein
MRAIEGFDQRILGDGFGQRLFIRHANDAIERTFSAL